MKVNVENTRKKGLVGRSLCDYKAWFAGRARRLSAAAGAGMFVGQGREGRKGCVGGGLFGSRGSGILRGGGAESAWRFRPGAASLAPGALEEGSRGGAAVADFGPVAFEEAL